jgi:hypothetical protein
MSTCYREPAAGSSASVLKLRNERHLGSKAPQAVGSTLKFTKNPTEDDMVEEFSHRIWVCG